jgi:hypothetical protein
MVKANPTHHPMSNTLTKALAITSNEWKLCHLHSLPITTHVWFWPTLFITQWVIHSQKHLSLQAMNRTCAVRTDQWMLETPYIHLAVTFSFCMAPKQGWPEPYIYTVYICCFRQRNHRFYGHVYMVYIKGLPLTQPVFCTSDAHNVISTYAQNQSHLWYNYTFRTCHTFRTSDAHNVISTYAQYRSHFWYHHTFQTSHTFPVPATLITW